ncbi:hypothetical protein KEM55_002622, partial [Ascosphaera atra]
LSAFMSKAPPTHAPRPSYVEISTSNDSPDNKSEPPFPRALHSDMSMHIANIMNLILPSSPPTMEKLQQKAHARAFSFRIKHSQASLDVQRKHFGSQEKYIPIDFLRSMFPLAHARDISKAMIKGKMINLAQLALDIIPNLSNADAVSEETLLELDVKFPFAFADDMDLALYSDSERQRITKATFEFGKAVRTHWLVKALHFAHIKGETSGENTYELVKEAFFAEADEANEIPSKFKGWEVLGLSEEHSMPGNPILPEEYVPEVKSVIKSMRKVFRKGTLDEERLRSSFPWEGFVLETAKWVTAAYEFLQDVEKRVAIAFDRAERIAKEERENKLRADREAKEREIEQMQERLRASQRGMSLQAMPFTESVRQYASIEMDSHELPSPPPAEVAARAAPARSKPAQSYEPPIRPFASFADANPSPSPAPAFDDLHISSPPDGGIPLLKQFVKGDGDQQAPASASEPPADPTPAISHPDDWVVVAPGPNGITQVAGPEESSIQEQGGAKPSQPRRPNRRKRARSPGDEPYRYSGRVVPSSRQLRHSSTAQEKHKLPSPPPVEATQEQKGPVGQGTGVYYDSDDDDDGKGFPPISLLPRSLIPASMKSAEKHLTKRTRQVRTKNQWRMKCLQTPPLIPRQQQKRRRSHLHQNQKQLCPVHLRATCQTSK